ncbi:HupE/UreJ family protein [Synechococcus sp. CCY 9618]|uniref:HupE/UreJ family protein n=1 Tax=Synechococcus sp. CCY 9618 TaxID=2815602 RepID=UPI001C224604|nr:HupE/UreJ family protein [Synechococcus sp. CCY 9618]
MTNFSGLRSWTLLGSAAALGFVLIGQPAQAHGLADGGLAHGFLHPILGVDHLLLLIGVGAAASYVSAQLLLWALAGAVLGGLAGAMGFSLPFAEVLAALAISAVALLILRAQRDGSGPGLGFAGGLVAGAVALHALLHGGEAPADPSAFGWWLGALTASVLVSGGAFLALRRLPLAWTTRLAMLLAVLGGALALAPLGLLAR